jgi:hypothetical protein
MGTTVALNLMLGRSDKAALWIPAATVYRDGFEFDIQIRHLFDERLFDPFNNHHLCHQRRSPEEGLDPGLLRFGIQFSDGRKATNLPGGMPFWRGSDTPPEGPILWPGGGGGGGVSDGRGGSYRHCFWVWPLPPEGSLAFVSEWPAADIPETRNDIDSALLLDAAADAITVWTENESKTSH